MKVIVIKRIEKSLGFTKPGINKGDTGIIKNGEIIMDKCGSKFCITLDEKNISLCFMSEKLILTEIRKKVKRKTKKPKNKRRHK